MIFATSITQVNQVCLTRLATIGVVVASREEATENAVLGVEYGQVLMLRESMAVVGGMEAWTVASECDGGRIAGGIHGGLEIRSESE